MIRTCDQFKEQLLDLAYEELESGAAGELREHAASCADCRQALEGLLLTRKLAAQLPTPEPAVDRDEAILALASSAAAEYAAGHPLTPRESAPETGQTLGRIEAEPSFIDRLRGMLLKPALVTAAAASLVLVLTLFIHQNATSPEQRQLESVAGAPFHGPATPLADRVEEEDRELPKEASLARAEAALPKAAPEAPAEPLAELAPAADLGTGRGRGIGVGGGGERGIGTAGPTPLNPADQLEGTGAGLAGQEAAAKSSSPNRGNFDDLADAQLGAAAEAAPPSPVPQAAAPALEESWDGDESLYKVGMDAFNRGDCATAITALKRVVDPPQGAPRRVPSALHHLARCEKRTGRCGKAVLLYQRLLDGYSGYAGRPEAIWEAAGCHRRLGHLSQATSLLEELAAIPGWRERALNEKQNLQQLQGQK